MARCQGTFRLLAISFFVPSVSVVPGSVFCLAVPRKYCIPYVVDPRYRDKYGRAALRLLDPTDDCRNPGTALRTT